MEFGVSLRGRTFDILGQKFYFFWGGGFQISSREHIHFLGGKVKFVSVGVEKKEIQCCFPVYTQLFAIMSERRSLSMISTGMYIVHAQHSKLVMHHIDSTFDDLIMTIKVRSICLHELTSQQCQA